MCGWVSGREEIAKRDVISQPSQKAGVWCGVSGVGGEPKGLSFY